MSGAPSRDHNWPWRLQQPPTFTQGGEHRAVRRLVLSACPVLKRFGRRRAIVEGPSDGSRIKIHVRTVQEKDLLTSIAHENGAF